MDYFYWVLPWLSFGNSCNKVLFGGSVDSEEDVSKFHDCMKEHRSGILLGCTFLLIGYPILIAHLYYYYRLSTTIMAGINTGLANWLYIGSWSIVGTIACTIAPALGIFIAYYDWEFASGDEYIGYALQFQFWHFWLILTDCGKVSLGFAAAMSHIRGLAVFLGYCKSSHYKFSDEFKDKMMGRITRIPCGRWCIGFVYVFMISVCIFGGIGDALDFETKGFFSYHGGSQFLGAIILIAMIWQSFMMLSMFCKFEDNMNDIISNVESISQQDSLQMTQTATRR